jgi:arylsulfatase A-like enzyme
MAISSRPNLLYIFADQMRGMDMNCAGNSQLYTPTRLHGQPRHVADRSVSCC